MKNLISKIYNFKIKLIFIVSTVFIDLFTKIFALLFLPYNKNIILTNDISLLLIYNKSGYNSLLDTLGTSNLKTMIFISSFSIIFGVIFIFCQKIKKRIIRIMIYFLFYILFSLTYVHVVPFLPDYNISPYFITIIKSIGALFLFSTILYFIKDHFYSILWAIYLGGGFGNFLNSFYPPFYPVDFINSKFINKYLGLGIFNFADLFVTLALILIIVYSLYLLIHLIVIKIKNKITVSKTSVE